MYGGIDHKPTWAKIRDFNNIWMQKVISVLFVLDRDFYIICTTTLRLFCNYAGKGLGFGNYSLVWNRREIDCRKETQKGAGFAIFFTINGVS